MLATQRSNVFKCYTVEYLTSHLYLHAISIYESLGECVYQENKSDKWDMTWYTMRERLHNYTIL